MSATISNAPFFAYPGTVWTNCWLAMAWLASAIQSTPSGSAAQPYSQTTLVYDTLINGVAAIDAWQAADVLSAEYQNLLAVQALDLDLDPMTQEYFLARIAGVETVAAGLGALPPTVSPLNVTALLNTNMPAVADPGYLPWCMTFSGEAAPSSFAAATFVSDAQGAATAWATVAAAVSALQGGPVSQQYDAAARMWRAANAAANLLADCTSGPFATFLPTYAQGLWSQLVALPAILVDAAAIASAPYTLASQQSGTIRNVLLTVAQQLAAYMLALRQPQAGSVATAPLMQSDSLQDFAARNLGNFEDWPAVATLNGLSPPYPGPTVPGPSGQALLLPTPGATVAAAGAPVPSYANNVLGVDYDMGPVNGPMPAWIGDYGLIAGYANLQRALGRRLQTTLGSLIYSPSYGSRIPPEVGVIQTSREASRLAQYGKGALLADPRVSQVLSAVATAPTLGNQQAIAFSSVVQPIGPGASPVSVNATLLPAP